MEAMAVLEILERTAITVINCDFYYLTGDLRVGLLW